MKTPDDSQLVQRLQDPGQRRRGFELMVDKYKARLYWQIRHLVVYHDDADDILQDTFVKAWTNLDKFRGESKLSTWLYRIATNESLSFLQQQRTTVDIDTPDTDQTLQLEGDAYFDGDETEQMLQQAVASLPDKQRVVFIMKYFQEMKYEEMSDILQTSVGALKASYHIAAQKIEEYFHEHD